jgi:5-aminopentanamidase
MKIAAVQMDVTLGDVDRNLQVMEDRFREAADQGAGLIVFPECAVTGYCFESRNEAMPFAQSIPGPATDRVARICSELNAFVVFGMLERDGDRVFNAAVLTGPGGVIGSYRKTHLPFLGVDQHVDDGDRPFAVHQAGDVNVGMNICYDSAFPEASRCLTLLGADLIALPTNWPPGAECVASHVLNTRAMENAVVSLDAAESVLPTVPHWRHPMTIRKRSSTRTSIPKFRGTSESCGKSVGTQSTAWLIVARNCMAH